MKPELKEKLILVKCWECSIPEHCHKTEAAAARCIKFQEVQEDKKNGLGRRSWSKAELFQVLDKFRDGARKADLARELGLSDARVAGIIKQAERIERQSKIIILPELDNMTDKP